MKTKRKETRFPINYYASVILILIILILFPLIIKSEYFIHLAILVGFNILLVSGLNLIAGYTGKLSLGQAGFYAIGAYTSAILSIKLGWSFWFTLPLSGIFSFLIASILGVIILRLKGHFLAITTLGLGEIVRMIILNSTNFTGGPMGIVGIPSPNLIDLYFFKINFESKIAFYYLTYLIVFICLISLKNILNSYYGRAFMAIRDDETAARVMGVNTTYYKVLAFGISAFLAGIAGSLYSHYINFISPDSFTIAESINYLTIMIIGGIGTFGGPIIGSFLLIYIPEMLRTFSQYRLIIYGSLLIITLITMPEGIAGRLKKYFRFENYLKRSYADEHIKT